MGENRLLDALTCRGVLASVSVRYWRARKKLSPADLGLPDDKVNRRLISLGHKRLLPKERLAGLALIESRAHALLEANTFPFLNGIARYLRDIAVRRGISLEELDHAASMQFGAESIARLSRDEALRLIDWLGAASGTGQAA
jgi:hypothetical protein